MWKSKFKCDLLYSTYFISMNYPSMDSKNCVPTFLSIYNPSFIISSLISSTNLCKKAILCKLKSVAASISSCLHKWWRYAFVKWRQVWHWQTGSRGLLSVLYCAFLSLIVHDVPNAVPCLPSLVGMTQSNMSIPRAIASRRSSGVQTPIRYLGTSVGNVGSIASSIVYISSLVSPTLNHPIAIPSVANGINAAADSALRSG